MQEALGRDDPEASLQLHSLGSSKSAGEDPAVFHGQGGGEDDHKTDLARYLRAVDHAVIEWGANQHVPLLLASVDYYLPIYRSVTKYPYLLPEVVSGNPEHVPEKELHASAWTIVQRIRDGQRAETAARYNMLAATDRVTDDLPEIVVAAQQGRIHTLFVADNLERWGQLQGDGGVPEIHDERRPDDVDLLDVAAVATIQSGGGVHVVAGSAVPGVGSAAAVLRY
jgi:hypothetical protein